MNRRIESHLPGATAIVILMAAALLIPWLGETLFNSKGEPREALVAVSMLQDGDWILPRNFGTDIPYKPPFMAWIIASLAWLFNGGVVNEYLSRLPSALACVAMIGGGYFWARSVRGTRFAMIFSLVTLTAVEVFRAGIACRLDMILTACMVGAMYMLFDLTENRRRLTGLRYTAIVALLTVATLTKGPVGALLPCAVAGVYRLLRGRRFFPTFFSMIGLALAAMVIPAIWYYEAYLRGGKEFFDLMMEENFGRLTGNMSYESHENPWWYNFLTLIAGLCPWTLLLLITFFCFRLWTRLPRHPLKPAALFSVVAAVVIIGFYCIPASKRSVYLLPAYPFLCYGIASLLDETELVRPIRIFTWIMAVLAVLAPLAVVGLQIFPLPALPMATIPAWRYFALALPLAAGIAWMVNRHSPVGHVLVIVWAMYMTYAVALMPAVLNPKSDYPAACTLREAPAVATYSTFRPYSIDFYLNDSVRPVADWADASKLPAGSAVIATGDDIKGATADFEVSTLTDRSGDIRRPLYIAVKK